MIRGLILILAFIGLGCSASGTATQQVAEVRQPTPAIAATFYSDEEFRSLQRFHSSPGTAARLTSGVHVEVLGETAMAEIDYPPIGLQTQSFKHVRVLDGPAKGSTGWLAAQHVGTPTPMPRQ